MRNNIEALERNLNEASELRLVLQTLETLMRPQRRAGGEEVDIESVIGAGVVGYGQGLFSLR